MVGVNEYDPGGSPSAAGMASTRPAVAAVARHRRPLGFAWFAFRTVFWGLNQARDFEVMQLQALEVRARTSRLPVATDGELTRLATPLHYRIRPGELTVLAPPAAQV